LARGIIAANAAKKSGFLVSQRPARSAAGFEKNDAFDREIRQRFLDCYEDAAAGKLES